MNRRDFLKGSLATGLLHGGAPLPALASTGAAAPDPEGGSLPRLLLPHPSGARVEVFLQGAHVASWIRPDGEEALFLSRKSQIAPGAPIRGGIPVVFPQFASLGPLPSHGLVRTLPWEVTESGTDTGGAVFAVLRRTDTEATRTLWPHAFQAELRVALDEALTTTLRITNPGPEPFSFQSALHTYHRIGDIGRVSVHGLEGVRYLDRTAQEAERPGARDPLRIEGQTDRIYVGAPDRLRIHDPALGRSIVVEKEGFADAVVWNPGAERAGTMSDMAADEYAVMLCVEPANVAAPVRLEPGQTWSGTQRIRIESS